MFDLLFERAPDGRLYGEWLLSGLFWTLALAGLGWAIAFVVGVAVGVARTRAGGAAAVAARLYVELFRNIPLLVQLFLWYFVLPELLPAAAGTWLKQMPPPWGAFLPALLCLGFYTAARVAEQVRAGIEALPRGQGEAAAALGLSRATVFRRILLPQALRMIVPTLTSEVMNIYKNTSVALTIGVIELTAQARQISETTFQTFAAFGWATVIYLALALVAYQAMELVDRRLQIPGLQPARPAKLRARSLFARARSWFARARFVGAGERS
ncbi:amino acid ABC transporter permease [Aquabacter spiritensis]|uniref:L-glutamate ABC transporter membrane protein /L-aspartate ABC transporter membrane protein n=1 Tax=Aquabacter spiritensis TaxID=933073 RepID=A0A4R3LQV9_9HYPH|nr:amino acid ABC transporter permease [Aquabacter spiritensis]TCT02954.1 L-glutamate ABC transporter membrane protein /L-aspartate ABC transporter membrane protein [Aquabacter spiritensis]